MNSITELQWWEAVNYSYDVKPFVIERFTSEFVWLPVRGNGKQRRQSRASDWSSLFEKREDAVRYQQDRLKAHIHNAHCTLERLQTKLVDIEAEVSA